MKAKKILALLASMSLLLVAVLVPAMSASADDVEFRALYGTDEKVLESFNEVESGSAIWNNRPVCTEDDIQGVDGRAIQFNYNDKTATLATAWDMTGYNDGKHAFKLRIWAEKDFTWPLPSDSDWNIYFGNNTANTDETSIDRMPRIGYGKGFYLKAGWNEVYLPIVAGRVDGGSLSDLTAITHVRMYGNGSSGGNVWLDEIAVVSYTPADPVYDAVNRVLYLDRAEDMSVYMDRRGMYNDNNNQEGNAAIFSNGNWLKRSYPATNSHVTRENGAIKFCLYVANAEALTNMWFQIQSGEGWRGGDYESQKAGLAFDSLHTSLDLHDGWNEVVLPLSIARDFHNADGTFDLTNITFTHLEWGSSSSNLIGIDNLRIVNLGGACDHPKQTLKTEQVNATCVKAGTKAIYTCDDCETELGGETIPATGIHTYENGGETCDNCTEPNPNCDHKDATEVAGTAKEPTCTEPGNEANKECTCGTTIPGKEIPALGHNFGEDKDEPLCSVCGERNPDYVYVPSGPYYKEAASQYVSASKVGSLPADADETDYDKSDGNYYPSAVNQKITLKKGEVAYIVLDPTNEDGELVSSATLEWYMHIFDTTGAEVATFKRDAAGDGPGIGKDQNEHGLTLAYSYTDKVNWTKETSNDLLLDNYAELVYSSSDTQFGMTDSWIPAADSKVAGMKVGVVNAWGEPFAEVNDNYITRLVLAFEAPADDEYTINAFAAGNATVHILQTAQAPAGTTPGGNTTPGDNTTPGGNAPTTGVDTFVWPVALVALVTMATGVVLCTKKSRAK